MAPKGAIRLFEGDQMDIWIPTMGRVVQDTLNSLPNEIKDIVTFVVPWGGAPFNTDCGVMQTPEGLNGIAATRQWIIDQSIKNGSKKCLMLDDDLVFATRREDEPTKFRESTPDELVRMVADISGMLDYYAHVGVATREGGNRDTEATAINTRLLRVLAYRTDVLRARMVRFDRVTLMEDFDVALQLLELGYPNVKINWIVHNQRSSNAPGGCSTYRTLGAQSEAAYRLAELHPQFVKTVVKTTKSAWNGNTRTDVNIQWKRAFDSSPGLALLDPGEASDSPKEASGVTETLECQ